MISFLRDEGRMAIVLVEQYFDFAYDLGDEFLVMERGPNAFAAPRAASIGPLLQGVSV